LPARPIQVGDQAYLRVPIRTPVIRREDDLAELIRAQALPAARPGDVLFISEKVVAITQGRAVAIAELPVSLLARLLCKAVRRSPYGVGLKSPYSMQCALDECGTGRILLAAAVGALGKLVGRRGDFYRVAGRQAAAIDADGTAGIAEFRPYVIKGPRDPEGVARGLWEALGLETAVVDVNDLGAEVLGASPGVDRELLCAGLRDNPLGQGAEQTPMGLFRRPATAEDDDA